MSLANLASNPRRDDVLKLFGPLAHRITSEEWEVFADQAQFERLLRDDKDGGLLATYSLLRPSIVEGFASVTVASACITDTMWYRLWNSMGAPLEPVPERLRKNLRYAQHPNGACITIYSAGTEAWSKRYRDKLVTDEETGSRLKLLDGIKRAVLRLLGSEPFLWLGNKDLDDGFFGVTNAERLPNTPHGLNGYQDIHNVVTLSALNPTPDHFKFLEAQGISGEEVRTAHYRTAIYQAVMRCSIRNPADPTPKRVVVMDEETAEWLAALFPGATVQALPGMGVLPHKGSPGRPRVHADGAARTKACREGKKLEYLARLDLINGNSVVVASYPSLAHEVGGGRRGGCNENTYKERDYVTQITPPAPASTPPTCGTVFESIYAAKPLDYVDHTDDDEFVAFLRDLHGREVAKEESGLFSPAHFDPDKASETSRGLANVIHLRGIWLDNDGGDLTPDAFADLFPYLRVVIWNTASSTTDAVRWRAFIPTTYAMSIEVHRLIMEQVVRVLNRAGYYGKLQAKGATSTKSRQHHGFDESKFNAASLFYLPCQARDPEASFFRDYGENDPKRGPLDLHQWIERCAATLPSKPADTPVVTQSLTDAVVPRAEIVSSKLTNLRATLEAGQKEAAASRREPAIEKAVEQWRSTPLSSGHSAFFRLALALKRAGLDELEIKEKLTGEALWAASPNERKGEIEGILKSLRQYGTFNFPKSGG